MTASNCRGQMTKHVSGAPMKVVRRLLVLAGRRRLPGVVVLAGTVRIDDGALLAMTPFPRRSLPGISGSEHRQKQ